MVYTYLDYHIKYAKKQQKKPFAINKKGIEIMTPSEQREFENKHITRSGTGWRLTKPTRYGGTMWFLDRYKAIEHLKLIQLGKYS